MARQQALAGIHARPSREEALGLIEETRRRLGHERTCLRHAIKRRMRAKYELKTARTQGQIDAALSLIEMAEAEALGHLRALKAYRRPLGELLGMVNADVKGDE